MPFGELIPPTELGFVHPTLDRAAHRRDDKDFLDETFAAAAPSTFAILGDNILLTDTQPASGLFAARSLPLQDALREHVFLGFDNGAPRFATLYDSSASEALGESAGVKLVGLRQAALEGLLPPGELAALAEGKALLHWHRTHRFCATCGKPSAMTQAGWRRDCPHCNALHFPRTDPVVIMLAVRGDYCLMGRQKQFLPGMYSCLAGFCEPGETIEQAVRREIKEEAGIDVGRVRYLGSQPWPFPASLMIGCLAEATSETISRDDAELEDARWFSRDEVHQIFAKTHPEGIGAPGQFAIARQIVKAWASGADVF